MQDKFLLFWTTPAHAGNGGMITIQELQSLSCVGNALARKGSRSPDRDGIVDPQEPDDFALMPSVPSPEERAKTNASPFLVGVAELNAEALA